MIEYIYDDWYESNTILTIKQHYNLAENKFLFDISFNFSNNDFSFDHNKENDFIDSRNSYLDNLKLYHIDKVELYKNINNFSKLFNKNFYDDWYKDWTFKNKVNKYNL